MLLRFSLSNSNISTGLLNISISVCKTVISSITLFTSIHHKSSIVSSILLHNFSASLALVLNSSFHLLLVLSLALLYLLVKSTVSCNFTKNSLCDSLNHSGKLFSCHSISISIRNHSQTLQNQYQAIYLSILSIKSHQYALLNFESSL